MQKDKEKALNLLKQKINGEIVITYREIGKQTNYSRMQLHRLLQQIEKKDISSLLVHGLSNKPSNNSAPTQEIEYIKNFKKKYPIITISNLWIFTTKTLFGIIISKMMLKNIILK